LLQLSGGGPLSPPDDEQAIKGAANKRGKPKRCMGYLPRALYRRAAARLNYRR